MPEKSTEKRLASLNTESFRVLAFDYDETLAVSAYMNDSVVGALERARKHERLLVLVTGRYLKSLLENCRRIDLFDLVICENGAVIHEPSSGQTRALAGEVHEGLKSRLEQDGVEPLLTGLSMLATYRNHEKVVRGAIADLGLGHHIQTNKNAVMILPEGVDKQSGLRSALAELGAEACETMVFGDAENDIPLFAGAGLRVAVGNAVPALKEHADIITENHFGDGVVEMIDLLTEKIC
ncbi:MAG: HAD family hydrolase [Candidatus Obscuribacterales bacterium]